MGWAGHCICVCWERMHCGHVGVAIRVTTGCIPEQNPTVASWGSGSLPATPSLTQALRMAPSPSTFSFSHSVELLCGVSSSLPVVTRPCLLWQALQLCWVKPTVKPGPARLSWAETWVPKGMWS